MYRMWLTACYRDGWWINCIMERYHIIYWSSPSIDPIFGVPVSRRHILVSHKTITNVWNRNQAKWDADPRMSTLCSVCHKIVGWDVASQVATSLYQAGGAQPPQLPNELIGMQLVQLVPIKCQHVWRILGTNMKRMSPDEFSWFRALSL